MSKAPAEGDEDLSPALAEISVGLGFQRVESLVNCSPCSKKRGSKVQGKKKVSICVLYSVGDDLRTHKRYLLGARKFLVFVIDACARSRSLCWLPIKT